MWNPKDPNANATASLIGLSVADAFGNQFFDIANWQSVPFPGRQWEEPDYSTPDLTDRFLSADLTPPGPWEWTDDTQMACTVVEQLRHGRGIDPDRLVKAFAARVELKRDYGPSVLSILDEARAERPWRPLTAGAFGGSGSMGNGTAMRIAPLGAWFCDDLTHLEAQARLCSEVTHTHPDAIAGGIAVAVTAALAARRGAATRTELLEAVIDRVPRGEVETRLRAVAALGWDATATSVAAAVGNGQRTSCADTVPFCVWAAIRHLGNFPLAVRTAVSVGGDIDTNAAIVGGMVAAGTGFTTIPDAWIAAREPLPDWV
ncbi:ADP-ribosylglycohydrolase family protein [Glycomyces buryatensis]|uniref:ADP-ribosylglycohydrolase family protein n=1 Tax=Glycomyces buryatensis TaxID=2570927 RepID=A0A4S8Q373_9ACTN|nr:ADP-ribosylglycohydrolase family protein [Glycomyces buryatensis]THV38657.1 ADP-ribosylglycohydrolase family protein [Glycomyces buryatensis]